MKRKFTVVTELRKSQNMELIAYLNLCFADYGKAKRETFHKIKNSNRFDKSEHNTFLQTKYDVLKRTANSVISDAQMTFDSVKALKKTEQKKWERKIPVMEKKVEKLEGKLEEKKVLLRQGKHVSLRSYTNMNRQLVRMKKDLNRWNQKVGYLGYQIETNKFKVCFGTKALLRKDKRAFIAQRDSQLSFVGCRTESAGNQLFQLSYDNRTNQFQIQLRKDWGGYKNSKDKYVYGKCHFSYYKNKIVEILKEQTSPLSYKVIRKNERYFLHCTFEIEVKSEEVLTRKNHGVIGLDFNKGFVTLSETNEYGHLIRTDKFIYRFGQNQKTRTDLEQIASKVKNLALETGKDVIIEGLDFQSTKAKTIAKQGKQGRKYNHMLHTLAYSKFVSIVDNCCYRNHVNLIKVNPAWTSWIASHKFCHPMKLNVHIGASYVIARRGQGFYNRVNTAA